MVKLEGKGSFFPYSRRFDGKVNNHGGTEGTRKGHGTDTVNFKNNLKPQREEVRKDLH